MSIVSHVNMIKEDLNYGITTITTEGEHFCYHAYMHNHILLLCNSWVINQLQGEAIHI